MCLESPAVILGAQSVPFGLSCVQGSTANQGVPIQPEIQSETTNYKQFQQIDLRAFVPQTPKQAAEPPHRYSRDWDWERKSLKPGFPAFTCSQEL